MGYTKGPVRIGDATRLENLVDVIEELRDEMCDMAQPNGAWLIYWINRLDAALSKVKK